MLTCCDGWVCRSCDPRHPQAEASQSRVGEAAIIVWSCTLMQASAIQARYMDTLTENDIREIEQIHSSWIEFEVAGQWNGLMALCADDIELWPPDERPLLGRTAVLAQMAHRTTRIHLVEISNCRIQGSNEIAYLTANYETTFSSETDPTPTQALGSHLWILRKRAGTWVVALVSWSVWR